MGSERTGRGSRIAAGMLLAVFAAQALFAARRDSVTIDEFVHLPVGLYYLYTGDFRPDPINPPWTRMIAAATLLSRPPAFDPEPDMPAWGMGYLLERRNRDHYHELFVRARSAIVLLAVVLGALVFWWGDVLYGRTAALSATFLFAFSPNLLAHGHLVTLDLAGALGFTASAFALWWMLERGTRASAVAAGFVIGAATLLKLSAFVLGMALLACVAVRAVESARREDESWTRWPGLFVLAMAVACLVVNAGYGFEGTLAPLSTAKLDPRGTLAAVAGAAPWLRLPLPIALIEGIDMILNVGKQSDPSYFLAGRLSSEGWWYYHLVAFLLKTPLPIVIASLVALGAWLVGRSPGRRDYCLFIPVVVVFAANALFNSLQIGVRHVLPAYPLLIVGGGAWLGRALEGLRRSGRARAAGLVAAAGAVWLVAGTAAVAPRYLQYFNELAGGPEEGHRWLIDSNIDWGQDLIRLREYMKDHDLKVIQLAYFGRVDPRTYGIAFRPLERGASHGPAAVSASFLMGRPYFWYWRGRMRWVPSGTYTWLQQLEPVARAGSMFVFDLP